MKRKYNNTLEFLQDVLQLEKNVGTEIISIGKKKNKRYVVTLETIEKEEYNKGLNAFLINNLDTNLYFTIKTFENITIKSKEFIKEETVGTYKQKALVLDLDNVKNDLEDTSIIVADKLYESKIVPNYIICSGNGLHLYFVLDTVLENENLQADFIKAMKILFAEEEEEKEFEIDTRIKDVIRHIRIPNTFNVKEENNPKECYQVAKDMRKINKLADIKDFINKQVKLYASDNKSPLNANMEITEPIKKTNVSYKKQGLTTNTKKLYEDIKKKGIVKGAKNEIVIFLTLYLRDKCKLDLEKIQKHIYTMCKNNKCYKCNLADIKHTVVNAYNNKVLPNYEYLSKYYDVYSRNEKVVTSSKYIIKDFVIYANGKANYDVTNLYLELLKNDTRQFSISYIEKALNIDNRQAYRVAELLIKSNIIYKKNKNYVLVNRKDVFQVSNSVFNYILNADITNADKVVLFSLIKNGIYANANEINLKLNITSYAEESKLYRKTVKESISHLVDKGLIKADKIKNGIYDVSLDLSKYTNIALIVTTMPIIQDKQVQA